MERTKDMKSCIILSYGPVPTPEHTKVEGGGLRCWGLAKGLRANDNQLDITVAYHESYRQETFTDDHEGITIRTWNMETVPSLIQGYDSVLVSYCMGELSVVVADHVRPDQQLILDCYVPIYVEVSARDTDDMDREFYAFHADVGRWAHVLRRGDVFLCASEPQHQYYKGVLSAVGRINPVTYGQELILVAPYGIYREKPVPTERPITKLIGKDSANPKKILWFGGIYPWFDLRNLVDATGILNEHVPAKLVIVGAKNPFNTHPDFVRKYDELIEHINSKPEFKNSVIVQDWVEFDKRADWYLDSDLVVVVNKEGEENRLAWRTRLVDFLWADLPIITNGGDPLGETLLAHDAAEKFKGLSAHDIATDLKRMLGDENRIKTIRENLAQMKSQFYWDVVTKALAERIQNHDRARDLEDYGSQAIVQSAPAGGRARKVIRMLSKASMLPTYARKYGMRNTYYAVRTKVNNRLKRLPGNRRQTPHVVMISHQLDLSGAPYVFMDLARTIKAEGSVPIEFHTFNPAHKDNIIALNKAGIKPNIHITKEVGIDFVKGDVVVLNTVAHTTSLKESIYQALANNTVSLLAWFIHEDDPELLFTEAEAKRVRQLLGSGKIIMYIAAEKATQNYQRFFGSTENIRKQPYKFEVPKRFHQIRQPDDFERLSFILPGTMGDGRKGQLPVFYALHEFTEKYYRRKPDAYRDFELVYIGVEQDFMSRQILNHADKLFGKRFKHHGRLSHERTLELVSGSNVTICYSLRECLPLFVFEGMAAGHPVLRNDSSGVDEQLFEGKNGFYLDSKDYEQLVETFEKILNKDTTTNDELASMSAYSNQVALRQADNSYGPMVSAIIAALKPQINGQEE